MFPGNKHKAITFSFDDGVSQDIRLIQLFDKYNIKCTFNLTSARFGQNETITWMGDSATHNKIPAEMIKEIYKNHEVAVHTLHHFDLTKLSDEVIIKEINDDQRNLESLVKYPIVGMAYPYGALDERVVKLIKEKTTIQYARGAFSTYNFDIQKNLLAFQPTLHSIEREKMYEIAKEFLELKTNKDQILYIFGHAYEFDFKDTWDDFENFLKFISNKPDIFYGTNAEVLLNK